jgi:ABC-type dipeptide/oligopeptide/nickel transport system ATPase component
MIKIDFHIHTISTSSDSDFAFSMDRLIEYITTREIDCIAITNHNKFDLEQFNEINDAISITTFPGIEIDLEGGQILLMDEGSDLNDFAAKCQHISEASPTKKDPISVENLKIIFQDLSQYIIIPHYDKKPQIKEETLGKLGSVVTAGEVTSPKKFMYCLKDSDRLVPVYFSDCRISNYLEKFPVRQTFLDCEETTFAAIKNCLRDKSKVSLSKGEGNSTFEIFDDGQKLSTGLNVIIGERSSGKSYTLERICQEFSDVKYIRQFSLVERDEKDDERKFNKMLSDEHSLLSRDYLGELQVVVNDIIGIDLEEDSKSVSRYLDSLLKFAKETEKHDAFSKAKLFSEEEFQILKQKGLKDLIRSTQNLIENIQFRETIEKHISIKNLKELIVDLMKQYGRREQERAKKIWLNDLIKEIQGKLQIKSAATTISSIDLYKVAMNLKKVEKFNKVVGFARKKREIMRKPIQGFEIVACVDVFRGAGELKKLSRLKSAFSDAFEKYEEPYKYLQELKNIEGLEEADCYLYFTKIDYKILNRDGFEVSGGERSEFNLLQEIQYAQKYDMLLIDEPESSFDNIFLNTEVNEIIKDISKNMPVVLVTHNNTVGASIKPNYLLCTKKEVVGGNIEYRIYSGFPTSKELQSRDGKSLNTWEVTMGCFEAGEDAYNERSESYEDLKN